jgi:hypothetical protein
VPTVAQRTRHASRDALVPTIAQRNAAHVTQRTQPRRHAARPFALVPTIAQRAQPRFAARSCRPSRSAPSHASRGALVPTIAQRTRHA